MIVTLLTILSASPENLDASFKQPEISTVHFTVRYQPGMEELGIMAAGLSEDAYKRISDFLDHDLTHTIAINVSPYRTGPSFPREIRPGPVCRHILLYGGSRHIDVTFPGSFQGLRRSLIHKITHAFIYDMFADEQVPIPLVRAMPMPGWFSESLAVYIAGLPDENVSVSGREVSPESGPGLYSMTGYPSFPAAYTYGEKRGLIGFLDATYGRKCISELLRDMRDTGGFDEAIKIVTGKRLEELETDLSAYISSAGRGGDQRDFLYENREQIVDGSVTYLWYTIAPAVSPDGSCIAYLSATPGSTLLHVSSLAWKAGGDSGGYEISSGKDLKISRGSISSVDNRISWTADGKTIVMAGRSNGSEAILFIDQDTGGIVSSENMPFSAIMFPALSGNGRYISFTGAATSTSDIYIYDRQAASIKRITDDPFFERDPVITPDGTSILYSTNSNESGDITRGAFDIIRRDIMTGTSSMLVKNSFVNIHPSLSPDGKTLLYICNEEGPFNIYMLDLATRKTEKLTNYPKGALYPAWLPAGKGMAYVINLLHGTALRVGDLNAGSRVK